MKKDDFGRKLEEALVFGRRSSLARTPPSTPPQVDASVHEEVGMAGIQQTGTDAERYGTPASFLARSAPRCDTPEVGTDAEAWEDENIGDSPIYSLVGSDRGDIVQSEKKRKRAINSPRQKERMESVSIEQESAEMGEVEKMLAKVVKKTKELKKLVSESTKTKLDIKQATRELDYLVGNLERGVKQYKERRSHGLEKGDRKGKDAATQTTISCNTVSIQVEGKDIEQEKHQQEGRLRRKIREILQLKRGFVDVESILDVPWPEDMYRKTKVAYLNASSCNEQGDLAILLDPKAVADNKAVESLIPLYPEIKEMASKSTGEIDYVIKVVATKTRSQKTSEMSSALYILPLKIDKAGINNMEDAYNILVELKNTMSVHPTNTLRIILSEGLNQDYIRKLCESVFVDITVNIIILSESKIRQKTVKNRTPKPQI